MIKFMKTDPLGELPTRGTEFSAGLDLYATDIISLTKKTYNIHTGIAVEIPQGYVGLLCIRSSLASNGNMLANSVGVIDSDYRGEIIIKFDRKRYDESLIKIESGDRIAQLVIVPCLLDAAKMVKRLPTTKRGKGGFGSTGKK